MDRDPGVLDLLIVGLIVNLKPNIDRESVGKVQPLLRYRHANSAMLSIRPPSSSTNLVGVNTALKGMCSLVNIATADL